MAHWTEAIVAFLLIQFISAAQPSIVRRQSSLSASQTEEVSSPLKESSESSEASSIVMSDSREVLTKHPSVIKDPSELSFMDMAALINYRYAKQHGYDFTIYQMEGCSHSSLGPRHPSWCKLVSLVHTQHLHPNNKYRVFLDSDMFVDGQQHNISIDELLNAALPEMPSEIQGTCGHGYLCEANCSKLVHEGDAWLQTEGGNTNPGLLGAFVILRGGERGDAVLKRVWNIGKDYNKRFPWEQVAWKRTYDQSLHSDRRIVGIGGLDAPWTGYAKPKRCNQFGNLRLAGFTRHSCHFDDDVLLMGNIGSRDARERLRKLFECEKGGKSPHAIELHNEEEEKLIEHHNMYAGNRHIEYLSKFQSLNLTENEFRQLYAEAYKSKVKLSQDDMNRLTREMEVAHRSKEMEEADAGSVSLTEGTSEGHLYQQEALEEEYYNDKETEASIKLNPGQLPKGKWRKLESLCEEFIEAADHDAGAAEALLEPAWGSIVESIQESFDSFDAIRASLISSETGEEPSQRSMLLQSACDGLGKEPYLVHPFDTKITEYNDYVRSNIPSLAELQKMPTDLLAMEKLMSRLAQKSTIRVVAIGGSMTKGQDCLTPSGETASQCAWSAGLQRWLKKAFPKADVRVTNMGISATSTPARLVRMDVDMRNATKLYGKTDLWILDHGINDAIGDMGRSPPADRDHAALGSVSVDDIMSIGTEALILKILRIDPTAAMMLLATGCDQCLAFKENELKIARHHHIPYVDYGFLVEQHSEECRPMRASEAACNDAAHRCRHCAWWEGSVHVNWSTHQRIADAIGYVMGRALASVCKAKPLQTNSEMFLMPAQPFWSKTALHAISPCDNFLAQFHAESASKDNVSLSSNGWKLMEDKKGKPGWIATLAGAQIRFPLAFGAVPTIGLGFLRSYENMGQASIQIVDADGKPYPLGDIDGLWDNPEKSKVSVTDTKWYYPKVTPDTNMSLVVDITKSTRDSLKMKILSVVSC
jgi:hypothetical protein